MNPEDLEKLMEALAGDDQMFHYEDTTDVYGAISSVDTVYPSMYYKNLETDLDKVFLMENEK